MATPQHNKKTQPAAWRAILVGATLAGAACAGALAAPQPLGDDATFQDARDAWRLRDLRERMPNLMLQMLLRGQNLLGYRHYALAVRDCNGEQQRLVGGWAEAGVGCTS